MAQTSVRQDLQLAEILEQPQAMFVLWAIHTHFIERLEDFSHHFGDNLPAKDLVQDLELRGFLESHQGQLVLTEECAQVFSTFTPRQPQRSVPSNLTHLATRVIIVDDHPVLRRGLRASLSSFADLEVVGEASSGEEAVRLFAEVRPDIILMDPEMPGMGGIEAIRAILELASDAKIMVVSTYEEGDRVQEAFQAGAVGYQIKGAEIEDLVTAIRQAARGISSLAPAAVQALVRNTRQARQLGDDLTDRERQVLALLAQGLTNPAIADRMVITASTVKFHLHSIRRKLGTATRTETVAVALQHHLINLT